MQSMETIELIAAMPQEINPLLRRIGNWERGRWGAFRCYRFQIANLNCLLIECGIGFKRAAQAAEALLKDTQPRLLVSFGVAGALETELQVGDVVYIGKACSLEAGRPEKSLALASLSDAALQAAAKALKLQGAALVPGTTLTTHGSQAVRLEPGELLHPVLEMETAAIAGVAVERGIPLLSLRSISDNPQEPLPFDIGDWYNGEANLVVGSMIRTFLLRPNILPRLFKLNRNTHRAAENLAIALVAVLGQLFVG